MNKKTSKDTDDKKLIDKEVIKLIDEAIISSLNIIFSDLDVEVTNEALNKKETKVNLKSEKMAVMAINGGFELTVRDSLVYELQKTLFSNENTKEYIVQSEFSPTDTNLRADIAILETDVNGKNIKPKALIEMKNNLSCDVSFITGAPHSNWMRHRDNNEYDIKHSHTRIFDNYLKWVNFSNYDGVLYGINIISHISSLGPNKIKGSVKYDKMDNVNHNNECYEFYEEYLNKLKNEEVKINKEHACDYIPKSKSKPKLVKICSDSLLNEFPLLDDGRIVYKAECNDYGYDISGCIDVVTHKTIIKRTVEN